jgi:hypothetical protein
MKLEKISMLASITIASALLLGPGLFIPALSNANAAAAGLVPGAGGVQVINADGYGARPGATVSFPTYACASLPCTKDLQAKLDIPAATFPAYAQVFYVEIGSGWQNQVFSISVPQSIMDSPHNMTWAESSSANTGCTFWRS